MEPMMDGSGDTSAYIDSSVGALVWVRRRNGSWWPGRILAPEELPGSHLLSPRTGTPVKLLGREDGSVDWYNIEKSRRVKAFRCGEFDECIEKARGLASFLTKKREKYARREDAILHALELERKHAEDRALLGEYFEDRGFKDHSGFANDMVLDDDFGSDFIDPESSTDAGQASLDSPFDLLRNKKFPDTEWDDETADAVPRMRDLQDFDLKIAPATEKRVNWSGCEVSNFRLAEGQKVAGRGIVGSFFGPNNTNLALSALKRKRSNSGSSLDESAYKKRDRRRPSNQVLESAVLDFDVDSKASSPSFIQPHVNGHSFFHHSRERTVSLPEKELHASSQLPVEKVLGMQHASHMGLRLRPEPFDAKPVLHKGSSNFLNDSRASCCDERRPSLFTAAQMELPSFTGAAYVDSLLRGAPTASSPFLLGPTHMGMPTSMMDTSFVKTSSVLMAESPPSLPGFQTWPDYGGAHSVCERLGNDFSMLGHMANRASVPDYVVNPYNSTIQNNPLPFHIRQDDSLQEFNPNVNKGIGSDGMLLSGGPMGINFTKGCMKTVKPSLPIVFEESRGCAAREDEAESYQLIPASYLSSPEVVSTSSEDLLKQGPCVQQNSIGVEANNQLEDDAGFYTACDQQELTVRGTVKARTGRRNEEHDETSMHGLVSRNDRSSNASSVAPLQSLSKWQSKGRRRSRESGRSAYTWRSFPVGEVCDAGLSRPEQGEERSELSVDDSRSSSRPAKALKLAIKACSHQENKGGKGSGEKKASARGSFDLENMGTSGKTAWFNIPIEALQTNQDEHVRLVSVASELVGKPISGHPVLIEIAERLSGGSGEYDSVRTNLHVPPVWRTGRRTAMQRIPRNCASVLSQNCDRSISKEDLPTSKSYMGVASHKNRINNRKKSNHILCPPLERRFPSRFSKKVGMCPQKTRMLSSIAVGQMCGTSIKPVTEEVAEQPLVTCVPVSLVFNRIREALYKHASYPASDSDGVSLEMSDKKTT